MASEDDKKIGTIKIKGTKIIIGDPSIIYSGKEKSLLTEIEIPKGRYNVYLRDNNTETVLTISKKKDIPIEGSFGFLIEDFSKYIGIFDFEDYGDDSLVVSEKKTKKKKGDWTKWQLEAIQNIEDTIVTDKDRNSVLINTSEYNIVNCEIGNDIDNNFAALVLYLGKKTDEGENRENEEKPQKGDQNLGTLIGNITVPKSDTLLIGDILSKDNDNLIAIKNTSYIWNVYHNYTINEEDIEVARITLHRNLKSQDIGEEKYISSIDLKDTTLFGIISSSKFYNEKDIPKDFKPKNKKANKWLQYQQLVLDSAHNRFIIDNNKVLIYVGDISGAEIKSIFNTDNELLSIVVDLIYLEQRDISSTRDDEEQSEKQERKQKKKEEFAEEQSEKEEYAIEGIPVNEEELYENDIVMFLYGDIYLIPGEIDYDTLEIEKIKSKKDYDKKKKKLEKYKIKDKKIIYEDVSVVIKQ